MSSKATGQSTNYTLKLIEEAGIAVFHWCGPMTVQDQRQVRPQLFQFCRDHGVSKLIVDGRDQQEGTTIVDAFHFAEEVPREMQGIRIAVVHREDDVALQLIETVASNRGMLTRPFLRFEDAQAWLESLDSTTE